MTNIGYDFIEKNIKELVFNVPSGMSIEEIKAWLAGLEYFKNTVLELLDDMKRGQNE